MPISGLFDIGRSALFASQMGLYVTGHNIANVNTPGFNRQEVILETTTPVATGRGFLGRGVRIAGIKRYFDRFIYNQILVQTQRTGSSRIMADVMSSIEQVFNDANSSGLSGALREFYNAWQEVATSPELLPARNLLISKTDLFLSTARRMEGFIKDTLDDIERSIGITTEKINRLLENIGELNGKILQVDTGRESRMANDLRDQREELLKQLSELMDISYYEEDNGSISVMHGTHVLVERETVSSLRASKNNRGETSIYLNNQDITDTIRQGELGGLISSRKDIENYQLSGLRRLIASIIKEINLQHQQGYGLDGTTGNDFFKPLTLHIDNFTSGATVTATITDLSQLTLEEYEITFDSTNYYVRSIQSGNLITSGTYVSGAPINFDGIEVTISGSVSPDESIIISPIKDAITNSDIASRDPLKIAASSDLAALPSNNENAIFILNIFQSPIASLGNATFDGYYNELVSTTAIMSSRAQDGFTFEQNLMDELSRQRESFSGVSLDEEAINLIKYQRAFEAGARIIKVADELLQTLLNI